MTLIVSLVMRACIRGDDGLQVGGLDCEFGVFGKDSEAGCVVMGVGQR